MSIRMSASDVRGIKRLSERLQVNDSDVIRFAVKSALMRLAPLCEEGVRGKRLVPLLMESGSDLFRHFDLDMARLESIVNEGVDDQMVRVEQEDLRLIALHGMHRPYTVGTQRAANSASAPANGLISAATMDQTLRQYLYEKYVYASPPEEV
ncbi:MAG TPA: hypothetical protein VFG49_08745 [Dyella sp.]|uniref:hypothetical protein n=1 Tax=Dyella sp. TaxID=1869338 RepID=UPI002D7A0740|nr:hypothetical protein [Dyella sp.]HET6553611.1 hypothetical protein [Dyella sp.]